MIVRIRKEDHQYLAYFLDLRRMIQVNETGAEILELFFNQENELAIISKKLAEKYTISVQEMKQDVFNFLRQVKQELQPSGFNLIEQQQLNSPLGVEIEVTSSCNLRCRHCLITDYDNIFMDIDRFSWMVNILSKNGVVEASLIGGEPFKHPDILDMAHYCCKCDMIVSIVSNGTLIKDEHVERMKEIERLAMLISLDGISQDHDFIRGRGTFAKVDAVLKKLIHNEIAVEVICTLNKKNSLNYMKMIEYCYNLGVSCNFSLFKPFKPEHKDLVLEPEKFFQIIIDLLKLRRETKYNMIGLSNAAIVAELLGLEPRNECRATRSGLVINVYGQMITCPSLVYSRYYDRSPFPKFNENFLDTWKGHQNFVKFRERGLQECQARAHIFSKDPCGHDPYGISEFRKFKQHNRLVR